jgi:hypothetical protein
MTSPVPVFTVTRRTKARQDAILRQRYVLTVSTLPGRSWTYGFAEMSGERDDLPGAGPGPDPGRVGRRLRICPPERGVIMTSTDRPEVAFDTALAALHGTRAHHAAGDRKTGGYGRQRRWAMTDDDAISAAGGAVVTAIEDVNARLTANREEIRRQDAIYRQAPWSRFILCLSHDGHIHNETGCRTLHWDSLVEWHPELSGLSIAEAVRMPPAGLGPALCSVCFPGAPVSLRRKHSDVMREVRAGERAARAEAKFAKALRPKEVFKVDGDRVTTVAACTNILRKDVEFRDYFVRTRRSGSGPGPAGPRDPAGGDRRHRQPGRHPEPEGRRPDLTRHHGQETRT